MVPSKPRLRKLSEQTDGLNFLVSWLRRLYEAVFLGAKSENPCLSRVASYAKGSGGTGSPRHNVALWRFDATGSLIFVYHPDAI
jgi:hypothetical protein